MSKIYAISKGSWSKLYAFNIKRAVDAENNDDEQTADDSQADTDEPSQVETNKENAPEQQQRPHEQIAQIAGVLKKKSHRGPHNWNKRFFVLKDGFLLYYHVAEKRRFKENNRMNLHPKGILSLENCEIDLLQTDNSLHCITINKSDFLVSRPKVIVPPTTYIQEPVCICTNGESSRQQWLTALQEATRINTKGFQRDAEMINSLQQQNLQLLNEKQHYSDLMNVEAMALRAEKDKSRALEIKLVHMDVEKGKIDQIVASLRDELIQVREELSKNYDETHQLLGEKFHLSVKGQKMEKQLEECKRESFELQESVKALEKQREQLIEDIKRLTRATDELEDQLKQATMAMHQLEKAKQNTEIELANARESNERLEEERRYVLDRAKKMVVGVNSLSRENSLLSQELQEKHVQWFRDTKQLRETQSAWCRIERMMAWNHTHMDRESAQDVFRCMQIISSKQLFKKTL
ncbi:PH domain containing protein [Trichuris trichiura]|uniref:PH domain containing protein n=1 Tax=Trichuris trichiura TaxID=36087 RepID=A0A077YYK3_TRITR|nr:PH domain containing protein [Trichuris trichiura]